MSRNFELLQKIGKEKDIFEPEEVLITQEASEPEIENPVLLRAPVLNIGAKELEEVTKLVQRVFLLPGNQSPRSVVFMGTEPGNGCSWRLSDCLRFTEPIGRYVQRLSRPNLYLISAGSTGDNWQGLISSDRMRLRLSELRNEFDYVLIDSAAMSICNDGVALGCAADGVVLVLKANSSRREWARKAVHELREARAQVLGAVLNQRTFPIPESIYNKL